MKKILRFGICLALLSFFIHNSALAATATSTFQVVAMIGAGSCTVVSLPIADMDFGTLLNNPTVEYNATTSMTVNCSGATNYKIGLDYGINGGGSGVRTMAASAGPNITYDIYQDPARITKWGDYYEVSAQSGVGTGSDEVYYLYGRTIDAATVGALTPAATYSDTITTTVWW